MNRIRICILTLFFSLATLVNAQTTKEVEIITFIEEAPFFRGDLKEFIQDELVYPLSAKKDTIEGTVVIHLK